MDQFGLKSAVWEKQRQLMVRFDLDGAKKFLDSVHGIEDAFDEKKKCVCCMDEGTAHMDTPGKFALAGSGILYPAASWDERLDKVADLLIGLGVEEVSSHDGCGAAGLACKRDGIKTDRPDEYAIKWSQDLRNRMQEKLLGQQSVKYRHMTAKEMVRPAEFHAARVIWFDATGKFNPSELRDDVPKGFIIDYRNDTERATGEKEKEYPFEELKIALTIAFGDHGFGKKFDKDNKFVVVVLAEDERESDELQKKVSGYIDSLNISDDTRQAIKVDGYTARIAKPLKQVA